MNGVLVGSGLGCPHRGVEHLGRSNGSPYRASIASGICATPDPVAPITWTLIRELALPRGVGDQGQKVVHHLTCWTCGLHMISTISAAMRTVCPVGQG